MDLIQIYIYSSSSIKGCKCQPENSSSSLGFLPTTAREIILLNQLLAPLVSPSIFDSLESQLTLLTFGLFQDYSHYSQATLYCNQDYLLLVSLLLGTSTPSCPCTTRSSVISLEPSCQESRELLILGSNKTSSRSH